MVWLKHGDGVDWKTGITGARPRTWCRLKFGIIYKMKTYKDFLQLNTFGSCLLNILQVNYTGDSVR